MSKQGMKRPDRNHGQPKNEVPPVPELQGKAKLSKGKANPIIAGNETPLKVYHTEPFSQKNDL